VTGRHSSILVSLTTHTLSNPQRDKDGSRREETGKNVNDEKISLEGGRRQTTQHRMINEALNEV